MLTKNPHRPKLKGLIDAVRAVNKPIFSPDRWTGPAAFQSDIYPDRWTADRMREGKGVTHAYRDTVRTPSVPAFVVSAKQILKNLNSVSRVARTPATGTNNVALGTRASNKRNADVIDLLSSSPKRKKTEPPLTPNVIDLTQDDESATKFVSSRRPPSRSALANITNCGTGVRTLRINSFLFGSKVGVHAILWEQIAPVLSQTASSLWRNALLWPRQDTCIIYIYLFFSGFYVDQS